MTGQNKTQGFWLVVGDAAVFLLSLYIALAIRHSALPTHEAYMRHFWPFFWVFLAWIIVFYVADLYSRETVVFRKKLLSTLLRAQVTNSAIAVGFFYLLPFFGIEPRTILVLVLVVALVLLSLFRAALSGKVYQSRLVPTLVIGEGQSVDELKEALLHQQQFGMDVVNRDQVITADSHKIAEIVESRDVGIVILNMSDGDIDPIASDLYKLLFTKVRFLDLPSVYEEVYGRVPLEMLHDKWFLENISCHPKPVYTFLKRLLDIAIALPLAIVPVVASPFVFLANMIEGTGRQLFVFQERTGERNKPVWVRKFRSMTGDDKGSEVIKSRHVVTKVGRFLRVSRLDEFPQLWAVLKGEFSLIGPRPELPALVSEYADSIPYYNVRHLVPPGVTGWAQVYHHEHPHHGTNVDATAQKLSYDLFYVKNRSFVLDLKIALKTIKIVLSRRGT